LQAESVRPRTDYGINLQIHQVNNRELLHIDAIQRSLKLSICAPGTAWFLLILFLMATLPARQKSVFSNERSDGAWRQHRFVASTSCLI